MLFSKVYDNGMNLQVAKVIGTSENLHHKRSGLRTLDQLAAEQCLLVKLTSVSNIMGCSDLWETRVSSCMSSPEDSRGRH